MGGVGEHWSWSFDITKSTGIVVFYDLQSIGSGI